MYTDLLCLNPPVLMTYILACHNFSQFRCIFWLLLSHKTLVLHFYKTTYFLSASFWSLFIFPPFSLTYIETHPRLPFCELEDNKPWRYLRSPYLMVSHLHQWVSYPTIDVPACPRVGLPPLCCGGGPAQDASFFYMQSHFSELQGYK